MISSAHRTNFTAALGGKASRLIAAWVKVALNG